MLKRQTLAAIASLAIAGGLIGGASAQDTGWLHGITLLGELKYPPGFAHFDYVNPNAPRGGVVRLSAIGTFDTLNMVPDQGLGAAGLGLIYDSLMVGTMDENQSQYGLLAEGLRYPPDYSSATYKLRENAFWHDGVPITVADVIWSFEVQVANSPGTASYYSHVSRVEQTGEWEFTFFFDETGNRELPTIVGQLTVIPKHYWTGVDAAGVPRDILAPTLVPPLGSSAYRVKSLDAGRTIVYERVPGWWGETLNVNIGQSNFDEIRYEYFLDETVQFEAFKADQYDFRSENIARRWANEYTFAAVTDGRVKKEWIETEINYGEMLGYMWNTRIDRFQDVRVRRALTLAYPFEQVNQDLFYGQYIRPKSFFDGINLEADGLPLGRELEILEGLRDYVPPEVFTADYTNPVNGTPDELRANLREALGLLNAAGWVLDGTRLVNQITREPFVIEFLNRQPSLEPQALRYQTELAKLGIEFQIRTVDASQWVNRVRAREREYDVIYYGWTQSLSPGNELLAYFGSQSARTPGSVNIPGIDNVAVDEIIDLIIQAPNREELVAATKALDRVLSWNYYVMPGWTLRAARIAYWDRFSHPDTFPPYGIGFPVTWWWDPEKAARIGPAP